MTDIADQASASRPLRLLIIDDHLMVRQGLRSILEDAGDIDVVAEAATAVAAIAAVRQTQLDLVLSDMALPDSIGLELLKMIKTEQPKLPVLILSMYTEEVFAARALKLGAAGYLMKDVDAPTLVEAIRRVASGGKYISEAVAERLANQLVGHGKGAPHERLSEREFEVFRLIAAGASLAEMALKLHVSVKTVSGYRAHILQKTGFRTNADFTFYALEHHLID
ncbi:MAG: response regulator transcription factor [Polaromonas sp.]